MLFGVYDEGEAKLKRIGDDGNIIDQTGDFRLQLDEAPSPSIIEDHDRLVYLYDSIKGLLVFDYFGTLKNKLAFLGWQDFQMAVNTLWQKRCFAGTLSIVESFTGRNKAASHS